MRIKFPIGDWSDDGHGKCDWFIVESNHSVGHLREVHFSCKEKFGFDIGDLCREYEVSWLSEDMTTKLLELNVIPEEYVEAGVYQFDGPRDLLRSWLAILELLDPTFEYSIIDEDTPSIQFYGCDDKGRHLRTPGYGLFH